MPPGTVFLACQQPRRDARDEARTSGLRREALQMSACNPLQRSPPRLVPGRVGKACLYIVRAVPPNLADSNALLSLAVCRGTPHDARLTQGRVSLRCPPPFVARLVSSLIHRANAPRLVRCAPGRPKFPCTEVRRKCVALQKGPVQHKFPPPPVGNKAILTQDLELLKHVSFDGIMPAAASPASVLAHRVLALRAVA